MRKKYEYPCVLASMIIMLVASAKSKSAFGQKPLLTKIDKTAVDSLYSIINTKKYKAWVLTQEYWDKLVQKYTKPYVTDVSRTPKGLGLCYTFNNGDQIERVGGSIAWRNNNPGCIRYSEKSAKMGAIGKAFGFAIFPDEETGMRAIKILLQSDSYYKLTIEQAIHKYAPPSENNTERYIRSLCKIIKVSRYTKICDLTDDQLNHVARTIRKIEGWVVGKETRTYAVAQKEFNNAVELFSTAKHVKNKQILQKTERTI